MEVVYESIPGWWSIYEGEDEDCRLIDTQFRTKAEALTRAEALMVERIAEALMAG